MSPRESEWGSARLYLGGSGSFAVEVGEWASDAGHDVAGLIELLDRTRVGQRVGGHEIVAEPPAYVDAVAVAVVAAGGSRRDHWTTLRERGWRPGAVIHSRASVSPSAQLGAGCVIGPGAIVGAETVVGDHALISRGTLVGHHVRIGAFVSLLPGANVAASVEIGEATTVGMGAVIVDHASVGADAIVAAGAVVLGEVPDGVRVQGVPARAFAR